jgi:exodeoxyribonuclease VII large subunit
MTTNELFNLLKEKRREIATREGKELYMIFHNDTLERTAEAMPATKADLEKIKGWGGKKIEKYGDEILAIINGKTLLLDVQGPLFQKEEEAAVSKDRIFSIQEFISFINSQFSSLGAVKIKGEIISVDSNQNGYCFFTIKDSQTQEHSVSCYLSRWKVDSFSHLLEVGMEVVVGAIPSLYKNGRFSLTVDSVEPYGEGALKKAFEALKKKLEAKGYFDESRKRALPEYIQKIGLITSESGEAVHDFQRNIGEYGFEIFLVDVRVEGDYAEQSIVSAIQWFNKNKTDLDVLVLMRGGGGLESLKTFNSEKIAEAIITSRLPVITGIGHERDESIADYVADRRFSTPTAVAVFLRTQREGLITRLENYTESLVLSTGEIFDYEKRNIGDKAENLKLVFSGILERQKIIISRVVEQMHNGLNSVFKGFDVLEQNFLKLIYQYETYTQEKIHAVDIINQKCFNLLERKFDFEEGRLKAAEAALMPLNPVAILERGYSVIYGEDKKVIKEAKDVKTGERIFARLYKGKVTSRVEETDEK